MRPGTEQTVGAAALVVAAAAGDLLEAVARVESQRRLVVGVDPEQELAGTPVSRASSRTANSKVVPIPRR